MYLTIKGFASYILGSLGPLIHPLLLIIHYWGSSLAIHKSLSTQNTLRVRELEARCYTINENFTPSLIEQC